MRSFFTPHVRRIWRWRAGQFVVFGWGVPQSFTDIGNFDDAATFAALIGAHRIEVVREPLLVERRNYSPPMRKVAAAA